MSVIKNLTGNIFSFARWFFRQMRIIWGQEGASLYTRLIATITIASILMVVIFAINLVRTHSRVSVILATAGKGGEYYSFGENLKQVINNNQNRIHVETRETLGSCENMRLLDEGKVDLAIVQHDTPTKPSVQAISSLFPELLHLIVERNTDNIPDLKDKRIAVIPNLLGENGDPNDPNSFFHQLVKRYGIDDDIEITNTTSLENAATAFLDKQIDAIILFLAVGNECVGELLTQKTRPAKLLSIDVDAVETWYPYVENAFIQRSAFWGEPPIPDRQIPSVSVQALLLTHERIDKGTIQAITRILYEHRNKLIVKNPRAATMRLPGSGENLGIPLHAGSKAFYRREEPGFIVTYAEPLALFLSIAILCVSGMWHVRIRLQQSQKNRADMYNLEILGLIEQSRKIENLHDLRMVRQDLYNIFKRVLEDLDKDRISAESFQLFTFPCEVALSAMRHHELILMSSSSEK